MKQHRDEKKSLGTKFSCCMNSNLKMKCSKKLVSVKLSTKDKIEKLGFQIRKEAKICTSRYINVTKLLNEKCKEQENRNEISKFTDEEMPLQQSQKENDFDEIINLLKKI